MLRRILQVTPKAAAFLVASSVFVAAHATAPLLTAEELASCGDNNPWVKSGYCERNDAWNLSRCLCPKENASGGGGEEFVASTDDHCGRYIKTAKVKIEGRFSKYSKPKPE